MRVAIIGTGISALVAAWRLHPRHELTVFEAADRIGGHTNTVWVRAVEGRCERTAPGTPGAWAVDTGFIVHNPRNYPVLCRIFSELGVATQDSDMSFSVTNERSGLCWAGSSLNTVFAQRRRLFSPAFWNMLRGIGGFHAAARRDLLRAAADPELTLGEFLEHHRIAASTIENYVIPIGAAIWSASPRSMLQFPAQRFAQFLDNHGMLQIGDDRPRWRTVVGGSASYLTAITAGWRDRVQLNAPVQRVRRVDGGVELRVHGAWQHFDRVVIGCHSDQALAMLDDPSQAEREILGAIPYQANAATLHGDVRLMPPKRRAWSAWNHRVTSDVHAATMETYWQNRLQRLDASQPLLVSLNAESRIDPGLRWYSTIYHHPQYLPGSSAAQRRRREISGVRATFYCGAYWGHGFHEDGAVSGQAVADELS